MTQANATEKRSKSKIIIISLLILMLVLTSIMFYYLASKGILQDFIQGFMTDNEYTLELDEFIVNLKTDSFSKHYLKLKIALMYTDKKQSEFVEASVSKIRDAINTQLREKNYEEFLDNASITSLKDEIKSKLNEALNEEIIKEVYITDIIIQ